MTTDEQRSAALGRANEVRAARADWKRELRVLAQPDALRSVRHRLVSPPWWITSMSVFDLLTAMPRIGPSKARLTLAGCQVGRSRRVGDLVPRERQAIADWLEERAEQARREWTAA